MSHAFLGRKAYPIASQTGSQGTEFHVTAPNRTDAYFVLVKETKEEGGKRERAGESQASSFPIGLQVAFRTLAAAPTNRAADSYKYRPSRLKARAVTMVAWRGNREICCTRLTRSSRATKSTREKHHW